MGKYDTIETCRGVLLKLIDMDIARKARPVGPGFALLCTQIATLTACIKPKRTFTRNLRGEIAVTGHPHVDSLTGSYREGCVIALIV